MSFILTVLGSSSALPTSKRFPSAHVLNVDEHFFLIDCGEGTQFQLRKFKIPLSRINQIFISHLHGDHIFGLPGLISTFNLLGRTSDLHIYGHNQLNTYLEFYKSQFGRDLTFNINFVPVKTKKQQVIYEDKHVAVESVPLRHRIPVTGFIFREKEKERNIRKEVIQKYKISIKDIVNIKKGQDYVLPDGEIVRNASLTIPPFRGRSYAYCADTLYFKGLAERVKNVDLLYHEATFMEKDKRLARLTMHSTAAQAAKIAMLAGVGKLIIGHFSSRYTDVNDMVREARETFENTETAEDGRQYEVPRERKDT